MEYIIRKATDHDKEILILLSRKTISTNFPSFIGNEAVQEFINSGMADKEITDNIDETIVLEQNDEIIGLSIWKDNLLHLFMVDPNYQGSGAAGYFLEHISDVKLQEYEELYLECFENNLRANSFYKKCGWKIVGKELDREEGWYRFLYKNQRDNKRKL